MLYIPIRTTEGRSVGSVRVESGAATLNYSLPDSATAYLLTESGLLPIAPNQRLSINSPVQAIAVADDIKLLCYGLAPDCRLSKTELWAYLSQNRTMYKVEQEAVPPESKPVHNSLGAFSHQDPVPAVKTSLAENESVAQRTDVATSANVVESASITTSANVVESASITTSADVSQSASIASSADVSQSASIASSADVSQSASIASSEAVTAAFSELLRRANAVYRRIDTQHEPMHRPAINEPLPESSHKAMHRSVANELLESESSSEPHSPLSNDWLIEVDRLIKGIGKNERHNAVISNPFPNTFPNSSWTAVGGEGIMPHLEGEWQRGNELFKIIAVPGTYAPRPPKHLFGFTRFLRTRRGGFWIKLLDR